MTPKSSVCLIHTGSSPKLRGRICSFLVQNYCLIFCWVGRRSSLGSPQRGTKSSLILTCSQWYLRQGSLKTFLWKIIMCTLKSCGYISQEFFSPLVSYSLSFLCPFLTTNREKSGGGRLGRENFLTFWTSKPFNDRYKQINRRCWKEREFLKHHWKDFIFCFKVYQPFSAYNSYKSSSLRKSILSTMLLSCQLACGQTFFFFVSQTKREEEPPDRRLSCQLERCTKSNSYVFCSIVIDMKILSLGNLCLSLVRSDD